MYPNKSLLLATALILSSCSTCVAETIDLQWAICGHDNHHALRKLGMQGVEPYKSYNITYYDASPPIYTAKGLAFRTKVKHHQPVSMIKARFDHQIPTTPDEADCVWDRYGDDVTYTCAVASPMTENSTLIWSHEQKTFVERFESLDWAHLIPYGPFVNPKWKVNVAGYEAHFDDVMAEVDGKPLHLMEIELPVEKSEQKYIYKRVTKWLKKHHIHLCKDQTGKTIRLFNAIEKSSSKVNQSEQIVVEELK